MTKEPLQESIEKVLWATANKLRKNIDAAEYKHVVLGLIFLRYISESFNGLYKELESGKGEFAGADPEDQDEYKAENVFFVPQNARWDFLKDNAKSPEIGRLVDGAMDVIERENPRLKGVLPKVYARGNLDINNLGGLIDLISNISLGASKDKTSDLLGHVFEYFLGEFALAEGKKGGQFYTPRSVVELLVEMLEPYKGRVMDPCCGSGGMFVQSEKFVLEHQGKLSDISIYGQESNQTTWRLCKMNLAIRGIDSTQVKWNNEGSFLKNEHKDVKVDYILANPPFNDDDWNGHLLRGDGRWNFGAPPDSNANFGWLQHILYHLAPEGSAGVVLADTSLSTVRTEELAIRKGMVDSSVVDCIVQLPSHLFSNTQIKACVWFLRRRPLSSKNRREILFIDASLLGNMVARKSRELSSKDLYRVTSTYHNWLKGEGYSDTAGFCKTVNVSIVEANNYNLSPNRYIEPEEQDIDAKVSIDLSDIQTTITTLCGGVSESQDEILNSIGEGDLLKVGNLYDIRRLSQKLVKYSSDLFDSLILKYIIDKDSYGHLTEDDFEVRSFGELFSERKVKVKAFGFCPPIYSVTNSGIQSREGNFSKDLAASTSNYKIALEGDMVFGLSRQIPNLDVFKGKQGAFSGAYHVFAPYDIRIGLLVGTIMRLKLMEQTDILKGGAREGRGLDKEKLLAKQFLVPRADLLDKIWGDVPN